MCNVFVNLYLSYVQIISDKLQGESKKGEYRDFAYNTAFYLVISCLTNMHEICEFFFNGNLIDPVKITHETIFYSKSHEKKNKYAGIYYFYYTLKS